MPSTTMLSQETSAPKRSSFRSELQGLRALAVGLVLLFHLWPEHIGGGFVGVDVFFVVSGFLITGHLYRELTNTGTIRLSKFWARRVMRLLPLAFTVILFSLIILIVFLPETVWNMNLRQILGSLFYVENWLLAADSVDYMAEDNDPSLVQHYWSLSIEEQFYVLLPLILLSSYFVVISLRRKHRGPRINERKLFTWTLSTIIVLSLIFSVMYTNYDAAQAYFVTPTRFWEFATGGLLAMLPAATKISDSLQNILGWVGVGVIVLSALSYSGTTPFPGYAALLPVVGSALYIRYGSHRSYTGVYWWASRHPSVRMGDWSYGIYLWHWPLIILATYQLDVFAWYQKIAVILITFILSALSQRFIEDPLRHAKHFKVPRRAFTLMASSMVLLAAVVFSVPQTLSQDTQEEVTVAECQGADALLSDCEDPGTTGEPLVAATEVQQEAEEPTYPECDIPAGYTDFDRSRCSLGAPEDTAEKTAVVIGDSHARAWLPMLDEVGKKHNWNIQGYTKSGCPPVPLSSAAPGADQSTREEADACRDFVVESSKEFERAEDIDVIIPAASPTDRTFYGESGELSEEAVINEVTNLWERWEQAEKDVVVIGELPRYSGIEAPTCVVSNSGEIVEECSLPAEDVISSISRILTSAADTQDVPIDFYDPLPGICDEDRCYSMVGELITRYDHTHLASDFSRSFGPDFAKFLKEQELINGN